MRKNIKKIIIDCACALLSALGIGYLAGLTGFESTLLLLLFPALYMLEKKINAFEKIDNRFAFFALMLAFALFIGRYCEGKIQFGVKWVFFLLFVSKAIYNAAVIIYIKSEKFTSEPYDNKANLKCFFSYWAFIFAAWIPYFTASFPGVISYDSVRQIEMAQGNIPLSDHHPVLHTMIIKLFLKLGGGSPALYVVFQMLALSACFAFAANYVKSKAILPKWGIILTVCWFALNPLHAVFSINIQKDTLFAGAIVLLTVVLCEVSLTNGNALEDKKWFSLLIVSCILTVFLRNNGPYVVVLLLPVLFVFYKKYRKQISEAFAVAIVLFLIVKIGVFGALDVQKGSFAESVGIPLQQISRVVYDGKELTDKQIETLEQFISVEEIKEKYVPDCVDPLKSDLYDGGLDHQALEQNKGQFFGLWFQLLLKYPGEYIKAYADETLGYWYPLYKTPFISAFNMVFQNDCGLKSANLVPPFSKILGKFVYACFDGKIGAAFILFSMGAFVFASLYLLIVYIKHRGYKAAAPFLPAFLVWLSVMISSPIAYHLRYLYCFFCVIPLFIALALVKKNDKKVD